MLTINNKLYEFIINDLGGFYEQNQEKVKSNINNNSDDNKWYLGTYFPKSFKESYVLFSDIYSAINKYGFLNNKREINILDIGSGTGGEIYGILQVLEEQVDSKLIINIYSVDGNENALQLQENIYHNYWKQSFHKHEINFMFIQQIFKTGEDIDTFIKNKFKTGQIDIVVSFKALSELLEYDNEVYYKFLKSCENILANDGILLLDDVTCEIKTLTDSGIIINKYIPYTINDNIRKYIKTNHMLNIITPLCCLYNLENCKKNDCYSQCIIYSNMIVNKRREHRDIDCKIQYNLFIKQGELSNKLYVIFNEFRNTCSSNCIFKYYYKNGCYCNQNEKYRNFFTEKNFYKTQFSLVNIMEIYKEYNKR